MPKSAILWLLGGLSLASCSLVFDTSSPAIDAAPPPDDALSADAAVPGSSYPPEGRTIQLVDGIVGDVNGDGNADIVLANAPADGISDGFFVFFGPQAGPNLEFHHFVPSTIVPTAIGFGPGSLGQDSGHSTVFVSGRAASGGIVEAYIYGKDSLDFLPADSQAFSNGSDPSAIMQGTYDHEGAKNDVFVSAARGLQKFYDWLPTLGAEPPYATGETVTGGAEPDIIVDLGLIEGQSDDELLIVLEDPRIIWRYYSESNGPLSLGVSEAGDCGILLLARVAQQVAYSDSLLDIVALSDTQLCGYRIRYDDGREIQSFASNLAVELSMLPAPVNGFDDILAVNLGGAMEPEVVVLDTDNLSQTQVHFILDATAFGGGILAGSVSHNGVVSATFESDTVPDFLLALDFDGNGEQPEVWAFDSQGGGIECLTLDKNLVRFCW